MRFTFCIVRLVIFAAISVVLYDLSMRVCGDGAMCRRDLRDLLDELVVRDSVATSRFAICLHPHHAVVYEYDASMIPLKTETPTPLGDIGVCFVSEEHGRHNSSDGCLQCRHLHVQYLFPHTTIFPGFVA